MHMRWTWVAWCPASVLHITGVRFGVHEISWERDRLSWRLEAAARLGAL
jgi:hypothetical protein